MASQVSSLPDSHAIVQVLGNNAGDMEAVCRELDERKVPYLSYSKLSALEFCPQRYLLEYVERVELEDTPWYFFKGQTFHDAAARWLRAKPARRPGLVERLEKSLARRLGGEHGRHVHNAVLLLAQHVEPRWQVVAVEQPFVIDLAPNLPPCIGVIDLIVRDGERWGVVDHKTGKKFNNCDPLQLTLYREHVRRHYAARDCFAVFDEYRWVNNLERVRKPAFHRTAPALDRRAWPRAVSRFRKGYRVMQAIDGRGQAPATGNCYLCPFTDACPKAFGHELPWPDSAGCDVPQATARTFRGR